MNEDINEQIKVVAAFDNGKIIPLLFKWKNRKYSDLTTISTWNAHIGEQTIVYFTVTTKDQSNVYELYFGTRFFKWYLSKISHEP